MALALRAGISVSEAEMMNYHFLMKVISDYFELDRGQQTKPVTEETLNNIMVTDVKVSDIDLSNW